jgi:hypothetical protein
MLFSFIHTHMTADFSTVPLLWHDVIRKDMQTCTLLTEVSSSMSRCKVTDVTRMGEERLRLRRTDVSLIQHCGQNTTSKHNEAVSFCCVKLGVETLEINLYELTASFQCCIFETGRIEARGN